MSKRKFEETDGESKPDALAVAAKAAASLSPGAGKGNDQKELNDPEFVKDIEINELRNRYMLTRGSSQTQIHTDTGATVTTKGVWYPDRTLATDRDPPLYLHITASTKEALDAGVAAVRKLMDVELGPLTDYTKRPEREKRKWPEEKVFVGLETLRNFNVRAKVVGPGGLFVKHIQQETGARVQIRGLGSGFIDTETGREHDEAMHICLIGPDQSQLDRARALAEDLLVVVREEWGKAKAVLDQSGFGGGYTQYNMYGQPQAQYGQPGQPLQPPAPAGAAPPLPPGSAPQAPGAAPAPGSDAHAAYWQQIQSNPEYAAYYQQLMAYYAQQGGQQPGQPAPPGQPAAPQPPPPSASAPPPPPPGADTRREGKGAFGAVPPPPGL